MRGRFLFFLLAASMILQSCAVSTGEDHSADAVSVEPACRDQDGNAEPCPTSLARVPCSSGDAAEACMIPVVIEQTSNGTPEGTCLTLEIENRCGQTVYSYTCMETIDSSAFPTQCWLSTTTANQSVDVSHCGVTGRYLSRVSHNTGVQSQVDAFCLDAHGAFPAP